MKTFSAVITEEGGGDVSLCTELEIASQGDSIEEAIANVSADEIKKRLRKPSLFTNSGLFQTRKLSPFWNRTDSCICRRKRTMTEQLQHRFPRIMW